MIQLMQHRSLTRLFTSHVGLIFKCHHARSLFSKTGVWNPTFDHDTFKEIEQHWGPKLQKEVQDAQAR